MHEDKSRAALVIVDSSYMYLSQLLNESVYFPGPLWRHKTIKQLVVGVYECGCVPVSLNFLTAGSPSLLSADIASTQSLY